MGTKALFFDIDGTLVDNYTKNIAPSTFDALRETQQKGNLVFLNSGRTVTLTNKLGRIFHVDGMICGCGTHIVLHDETIYEHRLPLERCNEIKKLVKKYDLDCILEAQEGLYFNAAPFKHKIVANGVMEALKDSDKLVFDALDDETFIFDKLNVERPKDNDEGYMKFINSLPDFDCINRGGKFYECVPYPCSKGNGVEIVLDRFGIAREDAYVFGDGDNDISMFKCSAKNKITTAHHSKALEPYATYTTEDPLDDGIYNAMKHFGLI